MNSYRIIERHGEGLDPYMGIIVSNWLTTLRWTNDWFKLIDKRVYYETYKRVVHAILARPNTRVRLAVLDDDEDVCVGWAVYEGPSLHYCFVRRPGRKTGIAKSLVPKDIKIVTHLTVPGVVIWKNKHPNWVFNPFS